MVSFAPEKSTPLDSSAYSERDSIRESILALQEQAITPEKVPSATPIPNVDSETHHRFELNTEITLSDPLSVDDMKSGVIALIAAYNEARFIGSVVISALRFVDRVVVVDDGSVDDTVLIARASGADVVEMETNGGKGAAIQHGLDIILGLSDVRAIVLLDGDGQHDPIEIPAVIKPILTTDADLSVGSRFLNVKSEIPAWRQVGQHGLTWFTNIASGTPLTDSQSGFRALTPEAARQLKFQTSDFSMESEMQFTIHDLGLTAVEVPITCVYEEPSKRNPIIHGIEVVMGIIQLVAHIRPLFFGTICAVILWLVSAALVIDVLMAFNQNGAFPVASSLLTAGLLILGTTAFICGIVLQSVRDLMKAYLVQKVDI